MRVRRWKVVRQLRPNAYESRGRQIAKLLVDDPEDVGYFWSKRGAERHAQAVSRGLILGELESKPIEEWVWGHIDFVVVAR
jgi:hypothetical protein